MQGIGPVDVFVNTEAGRRLLVSALALPKVRATSVLLFRLTTDHSLLLLEDAELLRGNARSASALAKIRYLCRVRGIRSTAKQMLTFETIPGLQRQTLRGLVLSTIAESNLSDARKQFYEKRVQVVQTAERTFHVRGRNHRVCAKEFDVLKASPPDSFAGWRARQFEEVKLADKSLDVPRSVDAKELSRMYRQQIARMAFVTGLEKGVRNELCRKVSWAIHQTVHDRSTPESTEYCEAFELEDKQVLVGLDRNPKSAAVMSEQTYRAGMRDAYAGR